MQLIAYCKGCRWRLLLTRQNFLAMKMLTLILFIACLTASANGLTQNITISFKNAPLEKVFKEIERQSQYRFVYTKEQLANGFPVTIDIKNSSLESVLFICFKDQPVAYTIESKYILIKNVEKKKLVEALNDIRGKIVNENGEPVPGLTITIKGTNRTTVSNNDGEFYFKEIDLNAVLIISGAEIKNVEVKIENRNYLTIAVNAKISELNQVIMMAYGETTKRLNTGNISKVTAEEIAKQPVSNPLLALQGQVPGLTITQTSGINGAAVKVLIRGQNSLLQGSEPFYIIDGVPFSPGNIPINQLSNSTGSAGLSPFNMINPADIESIEILKDADATAIYGSRGANGVILITTKKGKSGKTQLNATTRYGFSKVTRSMDFLNTKQYLEMRREAFANDNVQPNAINAPDLILWDTTSYVDLKKMLIGGTANTSDMQLSVSGGSGGTQFLISGGYHRATTVFPNSFADKKASVILNLNHAPVSKKFSINVSINYGINKNELNRQDLTGYAATLPPIIKLYDANGNINFKENGVLYQSTIGGNPMALLNNRYDGDFRNLNSNLQFNYKIAKNLFFKSNLGYNIVNSDEISINPSTSLDPNGTQLPFSYFANQTQKSWIAEPQLEYNTSLKQAKLTFLIGATWQENLSKGISILASKYTSDIFLNSVAGAGNVSTSNSYSQYKYNAGFARIHYNLKDKYLINLTGRRDGSSRFGPSHQIANFGAAGFAWIFSNETFAKKLSKILSFGKIRTSYGLTGNDQIGDYKFIDTWTTSSNTFQGSSVINPSSLFNKDYSWEVNKKTEVAIDLGFFKDKLFINAAWFKNRSSNQIINYALPIQTGFNSIGKNFAATIQNQGLELQISSKNIQTKAFSWTSSVNITFWKNTLLDFPGITSSSYATTYVIGSSVNARNRYEFLGVDPATGIGSVRDVDQSGTFNSLDRVKLINTDPKFYGGFKNTITYKGIQLDILLEFRKQIGANYLLALASTVPGYRFSNQPVIVLNRWQKPGDIADIQKFTALPTSVVYNNATRYIVSSNAVYSDASYIRCKNIAFSYGLPDKWLKKIKMETCKLFAHAQNLFTLTNYLGADPENQSLLILPPLKTIIIGLQINL